MIWTCTVPMWNKSRYRPVAGFVLIEIMIVVGLMSLLLGIGIISVEAVWGNSRFKKQAQDLADVFQMAQDAAAQSDRNYMVFLSFDEQKYVLRQFASLDMDVIPEDEAIIRTGYFTDSFQLDYVLFDDLTDTRNEEKMQWAKFFVGRAGWQYGGKVVVLDEDGRSWSILISRMVSPVRLVEGDVDILLPQYPNEMRF